MNGIKYVLKDITNNWYRMYSIAKYELLSDIRDSRLGILWNVINPLVQIMTYLFVFGMGIRGGKAVQGIEFFSWMLVGMMVWFFVSPCMTEGVKSIHLKTNIITKMKFPVSILPITVVLKELFNHLFMLTIVYIVLIFRGISPSIYNLGVFYYMICAIMLTISINMITSVLNMFTRDVKKIVNASMKILMYLTPILWTMDNLSKGIQNLMKCNPFYYVVEGYRNCLLFHDSMITSLTQTIFFWFIVIVLFIIGSNLLYKFKYKFIDLI